TRAPRRPIDVHVFPSFRAAVKAPWLRKVAAEALAAGDPDGAGGVSIAIADDETLRSLNERFRGLDEVTDVLSFMSESGEGESANGGPDAAFPTAPDGGDTIGEVVLSYPLAVRQADEHDVTTEEELALLVVHGVLHLLGHDHEEPGDEARMQRLERQALAGFFGATVHAGGA
ncbi:MAG: rRNA maturation RNase YbeY, partial [Chloroflexi bacterium]|nr:rRNA maturation RNase YbeY [Chloroflexota bacterium]